MSLDFSPVERLLRDGRSVTLRPLTASNGPASRALFLALLLDGRGVVMEPDEVRSEAELIRQIEEYANDPLSLQLGAFVEGVLAGTIDIKRPNRRMIAHNGILSMGVHPDFQGLGLGRLLMEELVRWSEGHGVERIDLYTLADNHRAIGLYRSFGFETLGSRKAYVRRPDGTVADDLYMSRWRPRRDADAGVG
jgi:ribosomal protein S18 acetylase RimI-like enzyme